MIQLFNDVSYECSKFTTHKYSTSFSSAIRLLHKDLRTPIYNIYGFVRFADEIVDTFHEYNKEQLLSEFKDETYKAIKRKISLNPILNSFQITVNEYEIELKLIDAFFKSMEYDLQKNTYDADCYKDYVYGSAEVVGLICLNIFCEKDHLKYEKLMPYAQSLGAAFQKVDFRNFTATNKKNIEEDIMSDFTNAYEGITQLPLKARFGVYVAYKYYLSLFKKVKRTHAEKILNHRIRIPNYSKALIVMRASVKNRLNLI